MNDVIIQWRTWVKNIGPVASEKLFFIIDLKLQILTVWFTNLSTARVWRVGGGAREHCRGQAYIFWFKSLKE